jgi:glycosyltransferase involved in cell wall biosynthesis
MNRDLPKIAVIIPCFRVRAHIISVLSKIGPEVSAIYVVDDCCPEDTGKFVQSDCRDPRVTVLRHDVNRGVGGAVMTGYSAAIAADMQILVKVDGDDQMDTTLIPSFVSPIVAGEADYTKGNRFFDLQQISAMPTIRIFGNAVLSFMTKVSSGYWDIFDPTNGYTAIHASVAKLLPFSKISNRYFFETDVLFRLNTLRAVVIDIPMDARYGNEVSNMKIHKILLPFLYMHARNFLKRIFYNYYLRDMSLASFELPIGMLMLAFGTSFGLYNWAESLRLGVQTPPGTIMLAALPVLIGLQFILAFIGHDVASVPKRPFHLRYRLSSVRKGGDVQE